MVIGYLDYVSYECLLLYHLIGQENANIWYFYGFTFVFILCELEAEAISVLYLFSMETIIYPGVLASTCSENRHQLDHEVMSIPLQAPRSNSDCQHQRI